MRNRQKEDFILGILFVVLALGIILYSLFLPSPGEWMVAPGTVPIGLAGILGGLGFALAVQARRKGFSPLGKGVSGRGVWQTLRTNRELHRAFFAILFVSAYIFSIPYLQFYPASLLFVFVGIRIYTPRVRWYSAFFTAFFTVVGLFIIFSYIFGLPLRLGVFEYVLKLFLGRTYL